MKDAVAISRAGEFSKISRRGWMETMKEVGTARVVRTELNRVHMSPKRARVSAEKARENERERERDSTRPIYRACIHMQIPIDMTTFTYCIFALGHILARQFPIVGFRPPVRLIDIIGRAADTRLHFYLHTFANQFESTLALAVRSTTLHTGRVRFSSRRPSASTIARRFSLGCRGFRAVVHACHVSERGNASGEQVRRR